jgi:SAM-dependent methyltransferase
MNIKCIITGAIKKLREPNALEEQLLFLRNEVSNLRQIIRFLSADSPRWQEWIEQTNTLFNTQWHALPEGPMMLSDNNFRNNMGTLVSAYTGLPVTWFKEKAVLDAGCGNGRWSYALSSLGAKVAAVDQSEHGLEAARNACAEFLFFRAIYADLLYPLPVGDERFDLIWSFGVLHHTGDTYSGFCNIAPLVKPGGFIFLMLYGEPQHPEEFAEVNAYEEHRRATSALSFQDKIAYCKKEFPSDVVHGWFDAISPKINDLYRLDEIRQWLTMAGFTDITRTNKNRNLFIIAKKLG